MARLHAGKTFCPDCGTRREVEYDLETDETVCKHCGETIIPRSGHLSEAHKRRLRWWKAAYRPDAGPARPPAGGL